MQTLEIQKPQLPRLPSMAQLYRSRPIELDDADTAAAAAVTVPSSAADIFLRQDYVAPSIEATEPNACAALTTAEKDALFRSLVKDYGDSLYYFVLKRVRHPDDAAEIAQQAFVEAACSLTSYRGEAGVSTWIFGIATNLSLNYLSRAPQRRYLFVSDEVLEGCASPELPPCESLSQREGLQLVSEAMNGLPAEMAEALNLVVVEELSYAEAAIELDVPVGTVRSRVSRARAAVRKYLRDAGYSTCPV